MPLDFVFDRPSWEEKKKQFPKLSKNIQKATRDYNEIIVLLEPNQ